jgi:hypothetical protein
MKMEQTEFQNIGISTTDAGVSPEETKYYIIQINPLTQNDLQRSRAVSSLKIKIPSNKSR